MSEHMTNRPHRKSRPRLAARRQWRKLKSRCRRWWARSRWRRRAIRLKPLWWRLGNRGPGPLPRLRRRWRHSHIDRLVWEEAGLRARVFFGLESPNEVGWLLGERGGLRPRAARAVARGGPVTLTAGEVEGLSALLSFPHGLLAALLGHRGTRALCAELHALDRRERFGEKAARLAVRNSDLPCTPALGRACQRVARCIRHLPAMPLREEVVSLAFEALRLTVTGAEDERPREVAQETLSAEVEEDWEEEDEFWDDYGDEGKGADEGGGHDGLDTGASGTQALLEALGTEEDDPTAGDEPGDGPPPAAGADARGAPPTMLFGYERHQQALHAGGLLADLLTEEEGLGAFSIGFASHRGLSWALVRLREGARADARPEGRRSLAQGCSGVAHQTPGLREEVW